MKKLFILFIAISLYHCEFQEIEFPNGPGLAAIDSLQSGVELFSNIYNESKTASTNSSSYFQVGSYSDVVNSSVLKFSDFGSLNIVVDTQDVVIKSAKLILTKYKTWSETESELEMSFFLVQKDSSALWYDYSDTDSMWEYISANSEEMNMTLEDQSGDSLVFSFATAGQDTVLLNGWGKGSFVNTGFYMQSDTSKKIMTAFYSSDYYLLEERPRMELNCDIIDTLTGNIIFSDTSYMIYATDDMCYSESSFYPDSDEFLLSQGAIYRSKTAPVGFRDILNSTTIINSASLTLSVDRQQIPVEDTLTVFLGYSASDDWDQDEYNISTLFTSDELTASTDSLIFNITNLLQYYVSAGLKDSSMFQFFLSGEVSGYSRVWFNKNSITTNVLYTKISVE